MGHRRALAFVAAALAVSSCFYDSRWGETKRRQQSLAQHAKPGELRATPGAASEAPGATPAHARVLKLRAHATPRYAAEVADWPRRLADVVADANAVLGPTLDLRLELVSTEAWTPSVSDDDLSALVDELAASDPGRDVDRVVGLVGSVPRYEISFHLLGLARTLGKHMMLRTMNNEREYGYIQSITSELDEKERMKLHHARKRHKCASTFLHELGHTLGVPHELDRHTIMYSSYDPKVEGFSAPAADLMRLTLAHELDPAAHPDPAFSRAVIEHLQRTSPSWVPADRDAMIARMERSRPAAPAARAPRPQAPPSASSPAPPTAHGGADDVGQIAALAPADRATFEKARQLQQLGRLDDAWTAAKPLFGAYPDDFAVQDFRCQLAMKRNLGWNETQTECVRLMQLVPGGSARP